VRRSLQFLVADRQKKGERQEERLLSRASWIGQQGRREAPDNGPQRGRISRERAMPSFALNHFSRPKGGGGRGKTRDSSSGAAKSFRGRGSLDIDSRSVGGGGGGKKVLSSKTRILLKRRKKDRRPVDPLNGPAIACWNGVREGAPVCCFTEGENHRSQERNRV